MSRCNSKISGEKRKNKDQKGWLNLNFIHHSYNLGHIELSCCVWFDRDPIEMVEFQRIIGYRA
jgi:hypothetical protein